MRCRIESVGTSLPGKNKLLKKGSVQHAVAAGNDCLKSSSHHRSDVNFLINTGVYRDEHIVEPAMASFIQDELKMNVDFKGKPTFSYDLTNGGTGMLNGIHVLSSLIGSKRALQGMIVSSDVNSDKNLDPSYDYVASGSAVLLDISPNPENGFGSFVFKTFSQYSDLNTSVIDLSVKKGKLVINKEDGLEEAYLACIPQVFEELLAKENFKKEEVDFIFPSQVSDSFLGKLPETTGVGKDKIVNILDILKGDSLTTSPFIAYHQALQRGRIKPGMKIVFLTVGSGITIGCAAYYS